MEDIRRGLCPLCGHDKIVQAWPTDHGHGGNVFPVAAAESKPTWSGGITLYGAMTTFICQRCGYTQWFAATPADIPIGEEFNTRLIQGTR